MKKRFLPFSLLLVIMILGQSVMAGQVGHYVPRAKENSSAEAFINSMRVNQHTGLIDPAWMIAATKQAANNTRDYADAVYWRSMGPDNMGGRTTSLVYNNANMNEVYIGSMGGGVFYTWNLGISWHQVGENLMVSCMAQAEDGTIYVGTGDAGVAATYNGLGDLSYENSFVGTGLYTIKNNQMNVLESTVPSAENGVTEWSFINDIAIDGNKIIVATGDGVRYSTDGGNTWPYAKVGDADLTGNAIEVKVANHVVVASVDGAIYIGSLDNMVCHSASSEETDEAGVITSIATAAGLLDVAIAPSNSDVIYAANIGTDGNHVTIYASEDGGATWRVILPSVTSSVGGYLVYEGMGLYNHGLVVDPNNPDCVYVLGYNLWRLSRPTTQPQGYYMGLKLSSAADLHVGVNAFAFDPRNANKAYIATDGGIYKAEKYGEYFNYVNCNRGYITTRCLNVAVSAKNTRVIAGVLDQGPILIEGLEGTNNMETGSLLLPEITPAHYGMFDASYNAGPCAVSAINPDAFFVTTVDGGIQRTETGGVDYDFSNFTVDPDDNNPLAHSFTFTGYRMPIALWETFEDENSVEQVWFKCTKDQEPGDVVQCFSHNAGYPFNYTLTDYMHYDPETPAHSDSLLVPDPVTSKLYVVADYDNDYAVYYTYEPLQFSSVTKWFRIASFSNYPTCISVSKDGDVLFVGTANGVIERVSNLSGAVDAYTSHPDSAGFAPVFTEIELPVSDQAVTSIGIYSEDANKVVATLGNYGNDAYVMYSNNALSDAPAFVAKQGEGLPKMPVYSCVYTSTYDDSNNGHVLIGTEHGIYRTTDITASSPVWEVASDNLGDVPVLDLRQQVMRHDAQYVYVTIDSVTTVTEYPAINNEGVIYAATYGRGLFRCETYRQNSGESVPETPAVAFNSNVNMYPNPARDEAKISFELNDNVNVSYQMFDMSGRMVQTESLGRFDEGKHEVNVMVNNLAKGAYVLRLNAGNLTSSVKFMVF